MNTGEWRYNQQNCAQERVKTNIVYGIEESIRSVLKEIQDKGPFDGFLTFSQGGIFLRHMYQIIYKLDKEAYGTELSKIQFP